MVNVASAGYCREGTTARMPLGFHLMPSNVSVRKFGNAAKSLRRSAMEPDSNHASDSVDTVLNVCRDLTNWGRRAKPSAKATVIECKQGSFPASMKAHV